MRPFPKPRSINQKTPAAVMAVVGAEAAECFVEWAPATVPMIGAAVLAGQA
jgi:hypothetical protein